MLARRHRSNLISPARKVAPTMILAATALTLSACGSSGPDVSAEGQIDYACALIDDIKKTSPSVEEDWTLRVGDQTDPMMLQAMGAAVFAGGGTGGGAPVSEEMEFAARDIVAGISRLDAEIIQDGVDSFAEECAAR